MNSGSIRARRARWAIATALVAMSVGVKASSQAAIAQGDNPGTEVFSADVVIERSVVDEGGRVIREMPAVHYRVTRATVGGKQRTTVVYQTPGNAALAGVAPDPHEGMRVEFDEDGSPLRILNKDGQLIRIGDGSANAAWLPPAELRAAAGSGGVVLRDSVADRSERLRRDLGPPRGQFRGFEKYVTPFGDAMQEVLVARATATPVEINVVRNGVLESHSTYQYERLSDGSLVQRVWRDESRVPGHSSQRFVTQMTVSNVVAGKER
jgi:hypothetical protein